MQELFLSYQLPIIFLHVISAVVWVGGMVAMRYAAHQSFLLIESPQKRLEHILYALKRLFYIVLPFVITLFVTAFFLIKGYDFADGTQKTVVHIKEGIWSVMFVNLLFMIKRRSKSETLLHKGDMLGAKNQLEPIGKYMVPLNILLGITAIFLGVLIEIL